MKTIVVSAVNLNNGGTLTILRDCLRYLSTLAEAGEYKVVAIVYKKELADFPHITYMETQWPKQRWINRLWYEYVSLKKISKDLAPVYLWLSLHDTSPNVQAERRAVYCHNPFPFYKWKWREWFFTPKIVMFALFSKSFYRPNITKNKFVIVQQQWIRKAFVEMFNLDASRLIVALPDPPLTEELDLNIVDKKSTVNFIYASSPNSHKNFECLTEATRLLTERGIQGFKVHITVKGTENGYAQWLFKNWGHVEALDFAGFMDRSTLFQHYAVSDCLVFPSKVETWGLPITEFAAFQKPMLLADLPYAYETGAGAQQVAFFNPDDPKQLADLMAQLIAGEKDALHAVPAQQVEEPQAHSWSELFNHLLKD